MGQAMRVREDDGLRGVAAPVACACGCGAVVNERQREAQRMRANGWKVVEIAEQWMMAPGSVKALLHRQPSQYLRGHYGAILRGEGCYEQTCDRCGHVMFRSSPTKFCGRLVCTATGTHTTAWLARGIVRHVEQRNEARAEALKTWYVARRLRAETSARRRRYRSPEFVKHIERERRAFQAMREEDAYAWLAEQSLEVREFVEATDDPRLSWVSLDATFSVANTRTLHDRLPAGGVGLNPRDVEWHDPVGNSVADTLDGEDDPSEWEVAS